MPSGLPFHVVTNYINPCRHRVPLTTLIVIVICLFVCTFFLSLKVSAVFDSSERVISVSPESKRFNHTHAFITSAYYYNTSKSLGENAVAIVAVMSKRTFENLNDYEMTIVGSNGTDRYRSEATIKTETPPDIFCEYVMVFVQATTLANPEKLEIVSRGLSVEIPFRTPKTKSHSPVIICISPQFVAEKWQVFLMNIHVIRRYGGHLHVYITSMVQELFDTLKVYESWGSLTLDYWVRMKFKKTHTPYTEPMKSVEWRNQAGAQTDCLLQYKEAADYIAFFDIDDILIPRLSHNYHQEFSSHFEAYPDYHSIFYTKRDVGVQTVDHVTDFSYRQLFSTMKIRNETGYGKSIVDPLKYNSTWIHHSFQLPRNRMYKVLNTEIIHVKDVLDEKLDRNAPYRPPMMFNTGADPLIREADLNSLDRDFLDAFGNDHYRETAIKMVDHNYYTPIVFQCYNESFYHPYFKENKSFDVLCPNADACVLPQREDIKCVHSDAQYVSGPEMFPVTFHYAVKPFWSKEIGCFQ